MSVKVLTFIDYTKRKPFLALDGTTIVTGKHGGLVVGCQTPDGEVLGSNPACAGLCPGARHINTQEAEALSQHD